MFCALCQFPSETTPCTGCGNDYCSYCMMWHECDKPNGLFPHQDRGMRELAEAQDAGERRVCVTSPTGGGKTRLMIEQAKRAARIGKRVVIYTHRKTLIGQTSKKFSEQGVSHGMLASGHKTAFLRDIQIASIWTVDARVYRSRAWNLWDADEVIVDEAHNMGHATACKIFDEHYNHGASITGYTATPVNIGHVYKTLIVAGTNSELRKIGMLVPCDVYGPDEPDLTRLKQGPSGEFVVEDVVKRVMVTANGDKRPRIFGRVLENYHSLNPNRLPAVLFAPGVPESRWFSEFLNENGIPAAHIDADTSDEDRERVFAMLSNGDLQVVCNRFVLREGWDYPGCAHGILATAFGAPSNWLQAVGRILRAAPGKTNAILQDHGGHWHRDGFGSPNQDRVWSLDDTDVGLVKKARLERETKNAPEREPIVCPQCSAVRRAGDTCPYCGFKWNKRQRVVIQTDGSLKRMGFPKVVRKEETPDSVKHWKAAFWAAAARGGKKTFNQIRADWQRRMKTTTYPPFGMPNMPERGSPDWDRRLVDVFPNVVEGLKNRRKASGKQREPVNRLAGRLLPSEET